MEKNMSVMGVGAKIAIPVLKKNAEIKALFFCQLFDISGFH
jgi:hypothetical protein